MKTLIALLAVVTLLATAGCGSADTTSAGDPGPTDPGSGSDGSGTDGSGDDGSGTDDPGAGDPFGDGIWQLTSATVDGAPLGLLDTHPVTITVTGPGTIGGSSACNSYAGGYTLGSGADGGGVAITVGSMEMTAMACFPDEVNTLESAYLAALARVGAVARAGEELVLTGDGVELRFAAQIPEPDAALVGTVWVLDSLIDGATGDSSVSSAVSSGLVGSEATLTLDEAGQLTASGGCNGIGGTIVVTGDRWEPAELVATRKGCDAAITAQEAQVYAVLSGGPTWSIEGSALTLTLDDGRALRYLARPAG